MTTGVEKKTLSKARELSIAERNQLHADLVPAVLQFRLLFSIQGNNTDLEPHSELLGIVQHLEAHKSDLTARQTNHLKRMAALQVVEVPIEPQSPGDHEFVEFIGVLLGSTLKKARSFREQDRLPGSWRVAYSDLDLLTSATREK